MVSIISLVASLQPWVHAKPEVPCFFIFGDSLADNGNNNVGSLAKSNYQPYGIDFPEGPTGRFCNGRTISDIIAEHLGFDDFIPSFARALDRDILMGVNYASGGAGIRNETGRKLIEFKDLRVTRVRIANQRALPPLLEIMVGICHPIYRIC
ncbi:hypothetical protein CsSME_00031624 [Camellia sinensis var. sinensis]|uniref:GDSL esterase/lipase n=1 Tax=Camellia sinensis var. sinensis TaxID=542762 RepID=A0A4S4DGU7_CAMSN|nr:hypothetical protein TEA_002557 [Camellia sinensis var. sinensis]